MTARHRFIQLALSKLGSVVLWAENGPDVFDCSGLMLWAMNAAGAKLPDQRAQDLYDCARGLSDGEAPLPGDLAFYGQDPNHITHVGLWLAGGRVLSADGATSRVMDKRLAEANPAARVRLHDTPQFRRDYVETRRNALIDAVDRISL